MDDPSLLSLVLAGPQVLGALVGGWLWVRQLLARRRVVLQDDDRGRYTCWQDSTFRLEGLTAELLRTAAEQRKSLDGPFELYPRLLPLESRMCRREEALVVPPSDLPLMLVRPCQCIQAYSPCSRYGVWYGRQCALELWCLVITCGHGECRRPPAPHFFQRCSLPLALLPQRDSCPLR